MSAPRFSMRNPSFGRRRPFVHAEAVVRAEGLGADLRIFLVSFLGGLVFMTVYLA